MSPPRLLLLVSSASSTSSDNLILRAPDLRKSRYVDAQRQNPGESRVRQDQMGSARWLRDSQLASLRQPVTGRKDHTQHVARPWVSSAAPIAHDCRKTAMRLRAPGIQSHSPREVEAARCRTLGKHTWRALVPPFDASTPGFEVPSSLTVPNICSSNGLTGGSCLFSRVLGLFQGAPRRLEPVGEAFSSSQVRKTNTPFFAYATGCVLEPLWWLLQKSHQHIAQAKYKIVAFVNYT